MKILDCGAGDSQPPLTLFVNRGYDAHGIDISSANLEVELEFAKSNRAKLSLIHGDMRDIPYLDNVFSYVYTYNSICYLSKNDGAVAINEMERVLHKHGYLLVDFMSTECSYCGIPELGMDIGTHEYEYIDEDGNQVINCFYGYSEPVSYFNRMTIITTKKTIIENLQPCRISTDVWLRYFIPKPWGCFIIASMVLLLKKQYPFVIVCIKNKNNYQRFFW